MGFAGAQTSADFVLLAGLAGLLAGAFSMAAGEYVSMRAQRELFERQIELERAELESVPEEESEGAVADLPGEGPPEGRGRRHRRAPDGEPGDRARHARPRRAGPRPERARFAVGRVDRLVRGVRVRRDGAGDPVLLRQRGDRRRSRSAPRSAGWRCSASARASRCSRAAAHSTAARGRWRWARRPPPSPSASAA